MNTDSSDWKRFIPYSEELSSLYDELDTCADRIVPDQDDAILPPLASQHYNPMEGEDMGRKETPLEKQLTLTCFLGVTSSQLMDRFETAAESTKEVLDAVTTSLSSLQHIEAEYEEVRRTRMYEWEVSKTTTALHDECEEYLSDEVSIWYMRSSTRER